MVCQFLLYNKVNQLYVYIYPHIPSLLRLPPTLPISPLQVVTKHRADLPVLCGCFPLAIYFTFGSVYKSMPSLLLFYSDSSIPNSCSKANWVKSNLLLPNLKKKIIRVTRMLPLDTPNLESLGCQTDMRALVGLGGPLLQFITTHCPSGMQQQNFAKSFLKIFVSLFLLLLSLRCSTPSCMVPCDEVFFIKFSPIKI